MKEADVNPCVCDAKPGGCVTAGGDPCHNRRMSVECVASNCRAAAEGKDCGNQKFTRKQVAAVVVRNVGAKGLGVVAKRVILRGAFIVQYKGVVVDAAEFARRMKRYAKVRWER
jgi:AWS domain